MLSQAGGFDKLLLDSLYEDDNARRQLHLQNASYGYGGTAMHTPFDSYNQRDPFAVSNTVVPPSNMQMAFMAQQQMMLKQQQHQQMMFQQHNMMVPYQQQQHPYTQYPQQMPVMGSSNPFADPLPVPSYSYSSMHHQGNYNIM